MNNDENKLHRTDSESEDDAKNESRNCERFSETALLAGAGHGIDKAGGPEEVGSGKSRSAVGVFDSFVIIGTFMVFWICEREHKSCHRRAIRPQQACVFSTHLLNLHMYLF